jgi:hypothetical protein
MSPAEAAEQAVSVLDRPRAVLTIPRYRGAFVRLLDAFPGAFNRILPLILADARRKQRRWKQRIEAGDVPGSRQ